MLPSRMPGAPSSSIASLILVFAVGAVLVVMVGALIRSGLTALLEPRGHWLDRWRRPWFHPEREISLLVEALLIVAFVSGFARHFRLPPWVAPTLAGLWALHLPLDAWNWARTRRRPAGTLHLHERGFFLLHVGPLWLRAAVVALAAAMYLFLPPVRAGLDAVTEFLLASLEGWFN